MFFSLPGQYAPAGMFSPAHLLIFSVTVALVILGLYLCRHKTHEDVRRIIRAITLLLWVLEIVKILFVLLVTKNTNPNSFIPLYYCSLILYAGAFSSLGRGKLRQVGDVFLATGSLVGGAVFLVLPTTSLPTNPLFHFLSFHSVLLHGLMVFLGLLLLLRGVYKPVLSDVKYCALLITAVCAVAYIFNTVYDRVMGVSVANLMFVSKDFPGSPLTVIYHLTGPLFPIVMWLGQAFGPFLLVLWGYRLALYLKKCKAK